MRDWIEYVRRHLSLPEMKHLREERIIRELAEHLEDLHREARARGVPEAEAERLVRRRMGDWQEVTADILDTERPSLRSEFDRWYEHREQAARHRGGFWNLFADLGQDIRLALRTFRKSPVFTGITILTAANAQSPAQ